MHKVIFDDKVIAYLDKLPKEKKKRIFTKIISTKINPYLFFKRLKGRKDFKMRIGDHRVIADIFERTIKIRCVGPRKNIYKKL